MNNTVFAACFGASVLVGSIASAATLGLSTEGPTSTGTGGVYYLGLTDELFDDAPINDITLDTGPLSSAVVNFVYADDPMGDRLNIAADFYDIVDSGFTDTTLEFQLGAGTGFANGALFTISSDDFDFSASDPLDFFADNATGLFDEFFATADVSLQALSAPAAIPLPATFPLVFAGLSAFAVLGRRRKKQAI